uniref:Uncharacterized protein n=2 Tax=Nonomuraea gerenzanensis TaxID=93944 RepID=A0A1M4DVK5_9ACTN|nr:hypothetical protein BN4615_P100 [Nonomuraea gerenzanensis]
MFIHYKNGDIDAVFVKDEVPEIKPWKRTEEQKAVEPKKTRTRKTAKELESA